MPYILVLAWQDGKVEHIVASTTKATNIEHTIVDRVVVLLVSAMKTKRLLLFYSSLLLMFLCVLVMPINSFIRCYLY